MAEKEKTGLEKLIERLEKNLGKVYTMDEYVTFWGGENYPKPFVHFNKQATSDTIRHFAEGIGDINPLYRDENYGRNTKYKRMIAPPAFVLSIACGLPPPELEPDVIGWNAGFEMELFKPIYKGDTIDWKLIYPSDIQVKQSKMGGKSLIVYAEADYTNQRGETVAVLKEWVISTDRDKAVNINKYGELAKLHKYSAEELNEIYAAQEREIIRGSEPRYWEDVEPGEELVPVVQGPHNLSETLVWLIGCGTPMCKSDRVWRKIDTYNRTIVDPVTNVNLNLELIHLDDYLARTVGVPAAYAFGAQRFAWMSMPINNWMGDDGFLWKLKAELRRFSITGDTTWCKGKVVSKCIDNGKCCVDLECWSENQRSEVTIPGKATIILPSREYGPVVYPSPRP